MSKPTNKAELFTLFIFLVIGLGLYFTRKKWVPMLTPKPFGRQTPVDTSSIALQSQTGVSYTKTLRQGDSGEDVKLLQKILNIHHKNNTPQIIPLLVEDGKFGSATQRMLHKWTGQNAITINGLLDVLKMK